MSFLEQIKEADLFDFNRYCSCVTEQDIEATIQKENLTRFDFLNLLSPKALLFLETMAVKATSITRQYFGRTIGVYAPMYISDFCSNQCTYCGFNVKNSFKRKKLSIPEIEKEAQALSDTGIRQVLVLTGEAPEKTPLSYLVKAVEILKQYFASISLEIFPMDTEDYAALRQAGADSLTVFQEVYDRDIYQKVHLSGKKADYRYRLFTPDRGAAAGFRSITIGALFGLGDLVKEAFLSGIHAQFLEKKYPDVEILLSIPRMRKAKGGISPENILSDIRFVQFMLAWRLFMPKVGISISTRESPEFRDRLVSLGATKFSAGSRTDVGGYSSIGEENTAQFEISDNRSVEQVTAMIKQSGYQPVFKDWEII
ncbi:MAG: 2-iminoacetate synthase ThiH [Thermodesulfobacteriota bacterium]|nr:2-iminoacetate synthase ThiH [Thermodesulfobacteriota bacterium]